MTEFVRRVYEDGKITIPKEIRELHLIEPGDYVKVTITVVKKQTDRVKEP